MHVVVALGGTAEGSYEQEAAAVEEDEEMEREDKRGMVKQPDLNELDVPECAELALYIEQNGGSYCSASPSRDGDSEPKAERND
jgi:hypothetical protein